MRCPSHGPEGEEGPVLAQGLLQLLGCETIDPGMEGECRGAERGFLYAAPCRCLDQTFGPTMESMAGETEGEDLLAPDGHGPMLRRSRETAPGTLILRASP